MATYADLANWDGKVAGVSVVNALVVQPGDTLLLATEGNLTMEGAAALREQVMAKLPELADVVVFAGIASMAVYRP